MSQRHRLGTAVQFGLVVLACLASTTIWLQAANNNAASFGRIAGDIRYLSSDELEGRGLSTQGIEKAQAYIRSEFERLGLQSGMKDGSYLQPFDLVIDQMVIADKTSLVLTGPDGTKLPLKLGQDFQPLTVGGTGRAAAPLVFAGYGISAPDWKYDDYAATDVAGKIVLIIRREPQQAAKDSIFDGIKVTPHAYIRTKLKQAKDHHAAGVLLVDDVFTTKDEDDVELAVPTAFGTAAMGIPFAHISQAQVNRLLQAAPLKSATGTPLASLAAVEQSIDENLQTITQPLEGWSAQLDCTFEEVTAQAANVVGVLEGEGPLANQTIVIGAHYDHLGYGGPGSREPNRRAIHNGADDNASGTAALLETARRFAKRQIKPARRLVFMAFSAEERGLVGSNYYLKNPLFPLENTVAMFNYDMVGHVNLGRLGVHGTGTAKEFDKLVDAVDAKSPLELTKTPGVLGSSDHYGFYTKGIPAFHFFTGLTKEYHTPEDDFETLNVGGIVDVVDATVMLLDAVLALPQPPEYVKVKSATRGGRQNTAYLGVTPDYSSAGKGLKLTEVSPGSPAEKAGLKANDVIVQFGEITVADAAGLAEGLRKYKNGQTVKVTVERGDQQITLDVTLGRPTGK